MNPRVNIAYSIELNNIPKEVSLLIERVAVRLMKLPDKVQASYRSLNAGHTNIQEELERIDGVRQELAKIDISLMDCADILHGYQKALVQLREPQQPAAPSSENPEELQVLLEEAQDHLRAIKKERRPYDDDNASD
jgi:Mg2+ and Co2+ transporter CorA